MQKSRETLTPDVVGVDAVSVPLVVVPAWMVGGRELTRMPVGLIAPELIILRGTGTVNPPGPVTLARDTWTF